MLNMLRIKLLLIVLLPGVVFPCSILSYKQDSDFYMAGNEDWQRGAHNSIKFFSETEDGYGYGVLGVSSFIDSYPQIAINQEGLAVDWAFVPGSGFVYDRSKEVFSGPIIHEIMRSCSSVEDVIELINSYNIPHFSKEHMLVADRYGNSIVLEWDGDRVVAIPREDNYQIVTNFDLLNPEKAGYICDRFVKGEELLSRGTGSMGTVSFLRNILDSIKMDDVYVTNYSYIFHLNTREIIIYRNRNFSESAVINLDRELKKRSYIVSLDDLGGEY